MVNNKTANKTNLTSMKKFFTFQDYVNFLKIQSILNQNTTIKVKLCTRYRRLYKILRTFSLIDQD